MDRQASKQECARLTRVILSEDVDLIDAVLQLLVQLREAGLERDPDALRLQGFGSDSDAFPTARVRALWEAAAFAERWAARERYIANWRDEVIDACRALESRLLGELGQ